MNNLKINNLAGLHLYKLITNLSALFGLGILKSVIAVYVRAVRSGCPLSCKDGDHLWQTIVIGRSMWQ